VELTCENETLGVPIIPWAERVYESL
jgi:hypothetical protein